MPVPMAGAISSAVVRKMVLRPPARRMKNEAGMRIVAPDRPAMAVSVNSSAWLKGKPRLSICTVMMPHMPQTAKPHSRRDRDPQVAVGDALAGGFPEVLRPRGRQSVMSAPYRTGGGS
jgi:hypothetical protein